VRTILLVTACMFSLSTMVVPADAAESLRVGFFPNITHAQALVGKAQGQFEKKTGARIEWRSFNAGPSAMEALISGALDIAYVGPNPAVNAYIRSKGSALRIVAGAASGGASLVVRKDAGINSVKDFRGKRIASPEFGNTQDIALRHWIKAQGLAPNRDVKILTIKNPDILMLFQQKSLDAAWVPEPWVTRLLQEGNGTIFMDERKLWPKGEFTTAVLVVRTDFLQRNRDLVKRFVGAHVELSEWIRKNPGEAKKTMNGELAKIMKKPIPEKILNEAFSRLSIGYDPYVKALMTSARYAWELGYLPGVGKNPPDLAPAFDLSILNETLRERHLPQVKHINPAKR
jgi:NitT/TauT family transport system substrate-binding protein